MLFHPKNLGLAGAIVLSLCACVAEAQRAYTGPRCGSPLGVPCAPQRITYGYFPTMWRRWPTERMEAVEQPEGVPTPAPEPAPQGPEVPVPGEPGGPEKTPPAEPLPPPFGDEPPLGPPGEEPPPGPPSEEPPLGPPEEAPLGPPEEAPLEPPSAKMPTPSEDMLAPPKTDTPSPLLDDAPPEMPRESAGGPPAGATPAEGPSEPSRTDLSPPDSDAPPTMPDDDPFKDDPDSLFGPPAGATPKPDESMDKAGHEPVGQTGRWRSPVSAPAASAQAAQADAASAVDEPRRLHVDARDAAPAALPGSRQLRSNPLRSANGASGPGPILPTAGYPASTTAAAAAADDSAWRRNPLRSN